MSRLRRFPHHRFIGLRDAMRVHDCDDQGQFDALLKLDPTGDNKLQSFAPDTLVEARNRGFRPAPSSKHDIPVA
jgi:hypothetical protein